MRSLVGFTKEPSHSWGTETRDGDLTRLILYSWYLRFLGSWELLSSWKYFHCTLIYFIISGPWLLDFFTWFFSFTKYFLSLSKISKDGVTEFGKNFVAELFAARSLSLLVSQFIFSLSLSLFTSKIPISQVPPPLHWRTQALRTPYISHCCCYKTFESRKCWNSPSEFRLSISGGPTMLEGYDSNSKQNISREKGIRFVVRMNSKI